VGTNFINASSAAIGKQTIATNFISATQLQATIPASYLATTGTLAIDVFNPPPGGGFSASSVPITVGNPNPAPALTSIAPTHAAAGSSAFTLTATGTSFVQGAVVFFGNTALTTTVASATSATAGVPAALVASAGTAQVT